MQIRVACVLTNEEDAILNNLGLKNKMPTNWDNKVPLARYHYADIRIIKKDSLLT
jgi:hypothetical protein